MDAEPIEALDDDSKVSDYLRGAYGVVELLYSDGTITVEQAEQARLKLFDYAHEMFYER